MSPGTTPGVVWSPSWDECPLDPDVCLPGTRQARRLSPRTSQTHNYGSTTSDSIVDNAFMIDRQVLRPATRRGRTALHRHPSALGCACQRGPNQPARRGADGLDDPMARLVPDLLRYRPGRPLHRCRRSQLHRLLPRRHRRDDRARPAAGGRGAVRPGHARHHHDVALGRRGLGRGRTGQALRAAGLADGDDRDRRQPVRAALRSAPHRPAQDPGLRLVLPRLGRRGPGNTRRRRPHDLPTRQPRRGLRSIDDNGRCAVQRSRRARGCPCDWRDRLCPGRAGADQHRHRHARRGLPRRVAPAHHAPTARCW